MNARKVINRDSIVPKKFSENGNNELLPYFTNLRYGRPRLSRRCVIRYGLTKCEPTSRLSKRDFQFKKLKKSLTITIKPIKQNECFDLVKNKNSRDIFTVRIKSNCFVIGLFLFNFSDTVIIQNQHGHQGLHPMILSIKCWHQSET